MPAIDHHAPARYTCPTATCINRPLPPAAISSSQIMLRNHIDVDPLDWASIEPHINALLAEQLTPARVHEWLQRWSDLASVLDEAEAQIYRDISENTQDKAADARFRKFVTEIQPRLQKAEQALKQKLLAVRDYRPTDETALLIKRFAAEAEIYCDDNVPILSELRLLGKQYQEIIGGLSIEWQGQTLTIPQAEVLLADRDPQVRQRVWRLVLDAYLEQREKLNNLFMEMLVRRRRIAANAGLPDFRAYRWKALARFDYTPEDCLTFHEAIAREVVPFTTELYGQLAGRLGLDAIHPWDAGINSPWLPTVDPEPEPLRPFREVEELEATAAHIFEQVDPVFGGYFAAMRDGFLDLASRPNKAPGGYCNGFPVSGQPYIFMNAAGSHRNVRTLLHEGGHAFHFAESYRRQSLLWNYSGPMEFCEVASMGMELLSMPYWSKDKGGFYDEHDLHRAIIDQLHGIVFFLPYMSVMDLFQHWLYTEAPESVTPADLDRKWSELWDRFMPGIDYGEYQDEKATGWHRKGHIFGVPFYYIEYGLAQLGALQVWRNALKDQRKAVADYRVALAAGYTRSLPELFRLAGARLAFDAGTVGELMTLVRQQLQLSTHHVRTGTEPRPTS
ncbi:MAG: M3 family oligoendopeptidase [Caldilineae bacterium]|nr:MAG: M3 family oligoendopeptidase [Caldilineae bacterium]